MIFARIDNIGDSRIGDFFEDNTLLRQIFMDESMASEIIFHPFFGYFGHISRQVGIKSLIKHIARATMSMEIIFSIDDPVRSLSIDIALSDVP